MTSQLMPSTSTQGRFCDSYKSTFLKQVYGREAKRFDPKDIPSNSHHMTGKLRRLQQNPDGTITRKRRPPRAMPPVKKYPTTQDLCRPVGVNGYRRTLDVTTPKGAPAAIPDSWRAEEDDNLLQLMHRRAMLEKHLRSVRATLEEEAEKAVKQIRRRPASVQGSARSRMSSARSRATGRSGALQASARLSTRSGVSGMSMVSGRSGTARRPGTARSAASVASSFVWEDAFITTNQEKMLTASDATLRRTLMSTKIKPALPAKEAALLQVMSPLKLRSEGGRHALPDP